MGGSAILDPDVLVDSLVVDVIDGLRDELNAEFGVRSYSVFTRHITWSGAQVGQGVATTVDTEITPRPRVAIWGGYRYELQKCGIDEIGQVEITEVSISYTEAELVGVRATMGKNQQWLILLREGHGQASREKAFIHDKPPFIDREKNLGWTMWLRAAEA